MGKIEFQYFDGCPNSDQTLANLNELIDEGLISQNEVVISKVPDLASAEKFNFQGSPTILINGIDIYTERVPSGYNYTCRIYKFDNKTTGIIPKHIIKEKVIKLYL